MHKRLVCFARPAGAAKVLESKITPLYFIQRVRDHNSRAFMIEGFDDCIVGLAVRQHMPTVLIYKVNWMLDLLMEREQFTRQQAESWFDLNIGSLVSGDNDPVLMYEH